MANGQGKVGTSVGASDSYIPVKTYFYLIDDDFRGTSFQLSKYPPYHIKDAVDFEPLYPP